MLKMDTIGKAFMLAGVLGGCAADADQPELATAEQAISATPEVIADEQLLPIGVTVSGNTAFWVSAPLDSTGPSTIFATAKDGSEPVSIFEADVIDIGILGADANRLYWPMGSINEGVGGIQSKAKSGGPVTDLVSNRRVFAITLDSNNIYGASPDNNGQLIRVNKSGGPVTVLASNLGAGFDNIPVLGTNDNRLVFTQSTFETECDGRVGSIAKTGGAVTTVASGICNLIMIAVDGQTVYWTDYNSETNTGRVLRKRLNSTAAPVVIDTIAARPLFLKQDPFFLYYVSSDNGVDSIHRLPKLFSGRTTLVTDQEFVSWLDVDQGHVYWTTILDGSVKRAAKF